MYRSTYQRWIWVRSDILFIVCTAKRWKLRCEFERSSFFFFLQIESMSEALGMDKLSFMGKYTAEKVIDGSIYTKLLHKEDLSCVLLDIGDKINLCISVPRSVSSTVCFPKLRQNFRTYIYFFELDAVFLTFLLLCIFSDGKECTVHASRPIQCRSYPFMAGKFCNAILWWW